ncbi:MAG: hypothetical protein WCK96_10030 [Methylococcales bacterium]
MNTKQWLHAQTLTLPLIALMALTRFHHFGDAFSLPDASLAVFFFAGLGFARRWWLLCLLLLEAALIDYVAITQFSVSAFCVSGAYLFLIPTYAVLWFAGSYCVKFKTLTVNDMGLSIAVMALATSIAFFISNTSFYLLSGRPAELLWAQYVDGVMQYYPHYAACALFYGVFGLVIIKLVKTLPNLIANHKAI